MFIINRFVSKKNKTSSVESKKSKSKCGNRIGTTASSCLPRNGFGSDSSVLKTEDEVSSIGSSLVVSDSDDESSLRSSAISLGSSSTAAGGGNSDGQEGRGGGAGATAVAPAMLNDNGLSDIRKEVVPNCQRSSFFSSSKTKNQSVSKKSKRNNTSKSVSIDSAQSPVNSVGSNSSALAEQQLDHLSNKIDKLLVCLDKSNQSCAKNSAEHQQPIAGSRDEECVICVTFKASIQCLPCGHRVVCKKCFVKTIQMAVQERKLPLRCVVCRAKILRITNTTTGGYNMGHVMREQRRFLVGDYPATAEEESEDETAGAARGGVWNPIWTSPATSPVSPVTELFRDQRAVFFRVPEKFHSMQSPTDSNSDASGKDRSDTGSVGSNGSSSSTSSSGSCRFHRHRKNSAEVCSHTGLTSPGAETSPGATLARDQTSAATTLRPDSGPPRGAAGGCCELSHKKLPPGADPQQPRVKSSSRGPAGGPGRRSTRHRKHIQAAMLAAARTSAIALGPIQESDYDDESPEDSPTSE